MFVYSLLIQVSDVDQIMGLVQAENIQVIGEAYDVALDMSFPKGARGLIKFFLKQILQFIISYYFKINITLVKKKKIKINLKKLIKIN